MLRVIDNGLILITLLSVGILVTDGLQCYSCRGSAPNEVEANIQCLEKAYLEDCDDFYTYYSEVEDQNVLSYEYYYYEKEEDAEGGTKKRGRTRERDGKSRGSRKRPTGKEPTRDRGRVKRQIQNGDNAGGNENKINYPSGTNVGEYEYYYGDYNYTYDVEPVLPTDPPEIADDEENSKQDTTKKEKENEKKSTDTKLKLPKDPEHHCYSRTKKNAWESYTVEKGCKKISYCNSLYENNPEWGNPWNFCCDKTRCNAKLVKDKPQRIFGMGCRQTDDCIQGMTTRPICPSWFQSCPKISSGLVKMECRSKSKGNKNKYYYAFKEKKCYCSEGFHPRGPICASGSASVNGWFPKTVLVVFVLEAIFMVQQVER